MKRPNFIFSLSFLALVLAATFSINDAMAAMYGRFTSKCGEIEVRHKGEKIRHNGNKGQYCIVKDIKSTSRDIIWNFHSYYGYHQSWLYGRRAKVINWGLMDKNYNYPTVITVAFGSRFQSHFLVTKKNSASRSGLYEVFTETIIPHLEKKAGVRHFSGKRIGVGASMGGYNLAQIAFRKPELFSKLVFISPLCHFLSPWSTSYEIDRFMDNSDDPRHSSHYSSSRASYTKVTIALDFLDNYYKNPQEYEQNSLLALLDNLKVPLLPQVYLSTTKDDDYGLRPSAFKLRDALINAGFDVTFKDVKTSYKATRSRRLKRGRSNATHSMVDPYSLANFLVRN